jgi:lipoprotein-releasing system permease protein
MTLRQQLSVALRYTLNRQGSYLSGFLSRLSILGIILSISLLIIVLSVMNGFDREMRENILALVPQLTLKSWQPVQDWQQQIPLIEAAEGVTGAAPFVQVEAMLVNRTLIDTTLVNGIDMQQEQRLGGVHRLLDADTLRAFDEDSSAVLLGSELAARLELVAGDQVTLITPSRNGGRADFAYLTVRGLIHTGTEWDQSAALIHLQTASELAGLNGAVHGFRVVVKDLFAAGEIGWKLVGELPGSYYASDWTMTHGNLYSAIQLSRDLIGMLLLSIIAIASFNVVSSLVLVVIDKQGDIAILRALGATPGNIRSLFLLQGLVIALVGIVCGSMLGGLGSLWASELVALLESLLGVQFLTTDVYPIDYIPADLRWENVLIIALVTALMCFLAALYPAHRAAKFLPAEVLRHE